MSRVVLVECNECMRTAPLDRAKSDGWVRIEGEIRSVETEQGECWDRELHLDICDGCQKELAAHSPTARRIFFEKAKQ